MVQFDTQTKIFGPSTLYAALQYSKKVQIVIDGSMQESC